MSPGLPARPEGMFSVAGAGVLVFALLALTQRERRTARSGEVATVS